MNNYKNELFYKYAFVLFFIIAFFEGALIFSLIKSFDVHLKDKLALIASQIEPQKIIHNKDEILKLQQKYKIFPLYIQFIKITGKNPPSYQEGFKTDKLKAFLRNEKVLTYTVKKGDYIIKISTLYSTNDDKISIIKFISIVISFIIYLISLLVGYKFIDSIANQIDLAFRKLKNFNSNVSHELKTPLTIMKSEIELALMNENNSQKCERVLKDILEEINYISEITDKLLFLTKNYNKNKKFDKIDLEEIIFELYEKYGDKINFRFDFGDDEYLILGDKTLLKIALSNIIENSIKYGASEINFILEKYKNKIILRIKDNGIGIPKEKLPFIFDEFYRVDESHNKEIKGFGLGLSIVKNILNLHKAKVNVKSEGGVEFIIEFPAIPQKNRHSS
jgi:signal transduction histidine kinase